MEVHVESRCLVDPRRLTGRRTTGLDSNRARAKGDASKQTAGPGEAVHAAFADPDTGVVGLATGALTGPTAGDPMEPVRPTAAITEALVEPDRPMETAPAGVQDGAMGSEPRCGAAQTDPLEPAFSASRGDTDKQRLEPAMHDPEVDSESLVEPKENTLEATEGGFFQVSLSDGLSAYGPKMAQEEEVCSAREVVVSEHTPLLDSEYRGPNSDMQLIPDLSDAAADADSIPLPLTTTTILAAAMVENQDAVALAKIKGFCASILKKLAPPLLKEVEASKLRVEAEPFTPRVTRRAAAAPCSMSKRPKKATVGDTILLKALGITKPDMTVNEEHLQEFRNLFDSPIREQQLRILAAVFGKQMPSDLSVKENIVASATRSQVAICAL